MSVPNLNVVVITGNLTRNPVLRPTGSGMSVCELRVAVNSQRKNGAGEWVDKPNYFDVVVWGEYGETCAKILRKGRPVAVDGKLLWQEWEAKDGSGKRQAVKIIADTVQFLGSKLTSEESPTSQKESREPAGVGAGAGEDDIPF